MIFKEKTTEEKIRIMKAFLNGYQIQCSHNGKDNWSDLKGKEPQWDWNHCDYRIKQKTKKKFVQFETAEEFLEAQRVHGVFIFYGGYKYNAHINSNGSIMLSPWANTLEVIITDLENIFVECEFLDGTPCGKEAIE